MEVVRNVQMLDMFVSQSPQCFRVSYGLNVDVREEKAKGIYSTFDLSS